MTMARFVLWSQSPLLLSATGWLTCSYKIAWTCSVKSDHIHGSFSGESGVQYWFFILLHEWDFNAAWWLSGWVSFTTSWRICPFPPARVRGKLAFPIEWVTETETFRGQVLACLGAKQMSLCESIGAIYRLWPGPRTVRDNPYANKYL